MGVWPKSQEAPPPPHHHHRRLTTDSPSNFLRRYFLRQSRGVKLCSSVFTVVSLFFFVISNFLSEMHNFCSYAGQNVNAPKIDTVFFFLSFCM